MKKVIIFLSLYLCSLSLFAQINTDRVLAIGRNALYFEDYVLSIQYFNQVIRSKPWLAEPYFYRAVAKVSLDDYSGAEEDCSLSLERNPFLARAYYCRGIARQNQEKYDEAIADYEKGLEFEPENRQMLVNKAVANIQRKNFDEAEKDFGRIMVLHPRYTLAYLSRGAMFLEKGDTVKALADYNKAIELDAYYPPAYANRALIYYQTGNLPGALADLNEAVRLDPRQGGFYINRGLIKYKMNDLRGAMSDYDQVIAMDKNNLIARFNRGLLRAQVGDNNRAVEDFDVVIALEPDNYIAYYNRALLRAYTGDFAGSVRDFDKVLDQYPNFVPGYYSRAESKKKMNDTRGAERDYWLAYEIEQKAKQDRRNNGNTATGAGQDKDDRADDAGHTASGADDRGGTRERSDKNISKFNRLVVYDKEDERKSKYNSEIRGRVQDRNVRVDLEPQFLITYYEKVDPVKQLVYYNEMLENYNNRSVLGRKLRLTNQEAALIEDQIAEHFASINEYSSKIQADPKNADVYFGRGMDFLLVQDFAEAMNDFGKAIELRPDFAIAYFNRAVVRYKQLEYMLANEQPEVSSLDNLPSMTVDLFTGKKSGQQSGAAAPLKDNKKAYQYEMIVHDYDKVLELNPDFVYAYFNRGNLRCAQRDYRAAVIDYNEAIRRKPDFAEAYFNRGLTRLYLGDTERGIADLSKAGELGIIDAYSIIKRMTSD